jgi:hypothetical protein
MNQEFNILKAKANYSECRADKQNKQKPHSRKQIKTK